jgi:hypothetical protein
VPAFRDEIPLFSCGCRGSGAPRNSRNCYRNRIVSKEIVQMRAGGSGFCPDDVGGGEAPVADTTVCPVATANSLAAAGHGGAENVAWRHPRAKLDPVEKYQVSCRKWRRNCVRKARKMAR